MKKLFLSCSLLTAMLFCVAGYAHHSFAIFDFETQVPFEGTVETMKFRNPHIEMTIKVTNEKGEEEIVHFIEGAPANMMVRNGIRPSQLKKGMWVKTLGSPLIEDPKKFFLRSITTEDGNTYGI